MGWGQMLGGAAVSLLAVAYGTALAQSAAALTPGAIGTSTGSSADQFWLSNLAGKILVDVDGSRLAVFVAGNRLTLESPNTDGNPRKIYLTFLNSAQGLISGAPNASPVTGIFNVSPSALSLQFADGRSESWTPIAGDGVSLVSSLTGQAAQCTNWYPQGHAFSVAERQTAVAAYAVRLGVSSAAQPACPSDGGGLQAEVPKAATEAPPPGKPHPQTTNHKAAALLPHADTQPVFVRVSEVHAIDDAVALQGNGEVQPRAQRMADVAAAAPAKPSECLGIEADGATWGFRNRCGFAVQFAYCLNETAGTSNSCDSGAVAGGVPPNAFDPLFVDASLNNAGHKFRWIACAGGSTEVVPRLLRSDPPAGQCVRNPIVTASKRPILQG